MSASVLLSTRFETSARRRCLGLPEGFRNVRELGGGGFGRVALVESQRSGLRDAVKVVRVSDPTGTSRFVLEAQRWIDLPDHPNIAGCYFVRAVGDGIAIFSEYVEGGSVAD